MERNDKTIAKICKQKKTERPPLQVICKAASLACKVT
jgi:hypothetical protein